MHRNSHTFKNFRISPVEDFTIFAGFSCLKSEDTDRDLDEFIQQDAERHFRDRIAVTYKLADTSDEEKTAIGFATLQNDAIMTIDGEDLEGIRHEYPYKAYPAVKIGRLGIHIDFQRNHLGSLFLYMINCLLTTCNRTGCRYLTVDARKDKKNKVDVRPFYETNGFSVLPCRPPTSRYTPMYFDLTTFTPIEP